MEFKCAECIKTYYTYVGQPGRNPTEPEDAVTMIEGTAYCLMHARHLLLQD